ncbi:hypothetical protein PMAYCL1PPCAC_20400, partial [Pristionchus mayeri]
MRTLSLRGRGVSTQEIDRQPVKFVSRRGRLRGFEPSSSVQQSWIASLSAAQGYNTPRKSNRIVPGIHCTSLSREDRRN